MGVLNIYDITLARSVPAYNSDKLKVTPRVATPGAESAVSDCLAYMKKLILRIV